MTINGVTISSASVGLTYGTNTVEIVVEAEDGTTTTYTLTVTRAAAPTSDDADLTGITLSNGRLSPEPFDKDITNYTVDLTNSVSTEAVTPILSDEGASYVIMVRGNTLVDAGRPVSLDVGANVFTITVTASDGSTKKTYAISVSRAKAGGGGGGVSGGSNNGGDALVPVLVNGETVNAGTQTNGTTEDGRGKQRPLPSTRPLWKSSSELPAAARL